MTISYHVFNKKAIIALWIFTHYFFLETFPTLASEIENYIPPKVKLKFQSNPYLERQRTKPITWDSVHGEWTQELEDWEKILFKDELELPSELIEGPQETEDNYHNEKDILIAQDFERYQYAMKIGAKFLCNCINLKIIDMTNFSFVTEIGDGFLSGCVGLTTLDLSSLVYLRKIGHNFLYGCKNIKIITFPTLKRGITVGDCFLSGCRGLKTVDLSPLGHITSVGDNFLSGCSELIEVQLGETPSQILLKSLIETFDQSEISKQQRLAQQWRQKYLSTDDEKAKTEEQSTGQKKTPKTINFDSIHKTLSPPVGQDKTAKRYAMVPQGLLKIENNYQKNQKNLQTIDLSEFKNVVEVGNSFLSGCSSLTTLDLSPLSQVRYLGYGFLSGCSNLTTLDLSPLSQVTYQDGEFLYECSNLTTLDLSPLSRIPSIGNFFLYGCSSLTSVDFSSLGNLNSIGISFLLGCKSLVNLDLSMLKQVSSIGDFFLSGCSGLKTVDLSGLTHLNSLQDRFLHGCSSLTKLDFSALSQITSVGDDFLSGCNSIRSIKFGENPSKLLVRKTVNFLRNSEVAEQQELGVMLYDHYLLKLPKDVKIKSSKVPVQKPMDFLQYSKIFANKKQATKITLDSFSKLSKDLDAEPLQINLSLLRDHVTEPLRDLPHLSDADVPKGFIKIVTQVKLDEDLIKKYEDHLYPILQNLFEDPTIPISWPMYEENRDEMKIAFKHILQNFQKLLKDQKGREEVTSLLYVLLDGFENCQSRQALELNSVLSKIGLHLNKSSTKLEKVWHLINDYKLEAFNKFSGHKDVYEAHPQASQFTVINNYIGLPIAMRSFDEKIGKLSEGMIKELLGTFVKDYFNPDLLVKALYEKSQKEKPLLAPWEWRRLILGHISEQKKPKDHNAFFKIISGVDQEDFDATRSPITKKEIRYLLGQMKLLESSQEEAVQEVDRLMERLKPYEGAYAEFISREEDKEIPLLDSSFVSPEEDAKKVNPVRDMKQEGTSQSKRELKEA